MPQLSFIDSWPEYSNYSCLSYLRVCQSCLVLMVEFLVPTVFNFKDCWTPCFRVFISTLAALVKSCKLDWPLPNAHCFPDASSCFKHQKFGDHSIATHGLQNEQSAVKWQVWRFRTTFHSINLQALTFGCLNDHRKNTNTLPIFIF